MMLDLLFLLLSFYQVEGATPSSRRPNKNGRKPRPKKYPRRKSKGGSRIVAQEPLPSRRQSYMAILTRKLMTILNNPLTWWVFLGFIISISLYLFYYIVKTGGVSPENRRQYRRDQKRKMQFESISSSPKVNRSPINAPTKSIFRLRNKNNEPELL